MRTLWHFLRSPTLNAPSTKPVDTFVPMSAQERPAKFKVATNRAAEMALGYRRAEIGNIEPEVH